jgi:hypothetical protein
MNRRFLTQLAALIAGAMAATVLYLMVKGPMTLVAFIEGAELAGFICIAVGCFTVIGRFAGRGGFETRHARPAAPEGRDGSGDGKGKDPLQPFAMLILFTAAGVLLILLAVLGHRLVD